MTKVFVPWNNEWIHASDDSLPFLRAWVYFLSLPEMPDEIRKPLPSGWVGVEEIA